MTRPIMKHIMRKRNPSKLPNLADKKVLIGWFEDTKYNDGTTVAKIAAHLEFMSQWPFLRPTIESKKSEWIQKFKSLSAKVVKNGGTIDDALKIMGEIIKGDIQIQMRNTISPSNAPATIKRKGFDKPLYETGHMISSIQSRLEDE